MGVAEQLDGDETATRGTRSGITAPGSTPSTWASVLVITSVVGLALMRRSFRRML